MRPSCYWEEAVDQPFKLFLPTGNAQMKLNDTCSFYRLIGTECSFSLLSSSELDTRLRFLEDWRARSVFPCWNSLSRSFVWLNFISFRGAVTSGVCSCWFYQENDNHKSGENIHGHKIWEKKQKDCLANWKWYLNYLMCRIALLFWKEIIWYKFSFVMISLVNHKAFWGTYEGITTFYCKELAIVLESENNSHNCKLHP